MVRKITLLNHKGGVAKTTTSVELAVSLAVKGKRVLLIDFDQQANASQYVDLHSDNLESVPRSADLLTGGTFAPVKNQLLEGLDVVPSCLPLAGAEGVLERKFPTSLVARRRALADALRPHEHAYDFILVDCPPTLSLLVDNALVACPEILVPVKLDALSLSGAITLHQHVRALAEISQPQLRFLGALGTFAKPRTTISATMLERLKRLYGDETVFQTVIHVRESFLKAADQGRPLSFFKRKDPGAIEYSQLADEVISRGKPQ
ncbi:ParA family protein [Myxococcus vastator]|uniref:ParA family protein n=1 Tax=Myxococcus vastator TaxID=2709664 RepID=UPI0013D88EC8|nr:ParA family protein [Myxococcus vastator]